MSECDVALSRYPAVTPLLRAEAFAATIVAVSAYDVSGGSWRLFFLLVLAPDVAMIAFVVGPRYGRRAYNAAHTYVAPVLLMAAGMGGQRKLLFDLALIWIAHIGLDRTIGYGLKLGGSFRQTHLGPFGGPI